MDEIVSRSNFVKSRIETDDDGLVQLRISVDGLGDDFGFTLKGFDPECHEWMQEVIVRQFEDLLKRATARGREEVARPIRSALGLSIGMMGEVCGMQHYRGKIAE